MSELKVEVSKVFNTASHTLFDAWLNPELLGKFMTPGSSMTVPRCSNDPKVGGKFEIVMQQGDKELPHTGEYLTIKPHTEISFTWLSVNSIDGSIVTLSFIALSDTTTRLELVHTKFPSEQSRNDHNGGWNFIFDCLNKMIDEQNIAA